MSEAAIRRLLESRLNSVSAGIETAFDNVSFKPSSQRELWQQAQLLHGKTQGPTLGDGFRLEVGVFQVMLMAPKGEGSHKVSDRIAALRGAFKRGLSLTEGQTTVRLMEHPYPAPPLPNAAWYMVPFSVPYVAEVWDSANG